MPQATKIGRHVFQIDDAGLANAIDQELSRSDSLVNEISELKIRLDAAETARTTLDSSLSEAQTSLAAASAAKVQAEAEIVALQTKLDASNEQLKKANSKNPDEDVEEELDENGKPKPKGKGKPTFDSDEIKSYCKEFLSVVSEVTPALKKADAAFEPDFALSPIDYKAQYLKTIATLPAEAKARIDSTGDDRNMFVEHLYLALKPTVATETATAPTKADEGVVNLSTVIDQNRSLTLDGADRSGSIKPKEDSPTMKARKERKLPSAYSNK